MHLVVDVGNTETALGLFDPQTGELVAHWRLSARTARTEDECDHLLFSLLDRKGYGEKDVTRAVLGSVVPSATERMRGALLGLVAGRVFTVEPGVDLPIELDVEEPRTVGADRIVNTLAARELFHVDTIAVDLGTATTYDCITADGVFKGGVIAPGVQVGMEWLAHRAAKLPKVQFRPPERVIGRRTEACMESGIFYSTVDAIDGMVQRIKEEWDRPEALVVATGGYATRVAPHCRSVDRVEPFLTLQGLYLAGEHMAKTG